MYVYAALISILRAVGGQVQRCTWTRLGQGGEDALDALSCRSLSAKEPIIPGLYNSREGRCSAAPGRGWDRVAKMHRMP